MARKRTKNDKPPRSRMGRGGRVDPKLAPFVAAMADLVVTDIDKSSLRRKTRVDSARLALPQRTAMAHVLGLAPASTAAGADLRAIVTTRLSDPQWLREAKREFANLANDIVAVSDAYESSAERTDARAAAEERIAKFFKVMSGRQRDTVRALAFLRAVDRMSSSSPDALARQLLATFETSAHPAGLAVLLVAGAAGAFDADAMAETKRVANLDAAAAAQRVVLAWSNGASARPSKWRLAANLWNALSDKKMEPKALEMVWRRRGEPEHVEF